jgi:serine/threonine-protein kinase
MSSETSSQDTRRYPRIGNYEVLAHVATGGMGRIYKAIDPATGQVVALKLLAPERAGRPNVLARFGREARHAARLRHENIVTLYEFGEAEGTYFLAMEFVDGIDLQEHITRCGVLKVEEALELLKQMTRALDHVHRQGLIHRDVKPSNFLLTQADGRPLVKLTDMGLAIETSGEDFRLTQDGHTVGTIDYMPPEQARDSRAADIRSDIYSLGCTFYHMLTGAPPFADGSLAERVYKHAEAPPPDPRVLNPSVPAWLVAVLDRMLAKKPADRYQAPAELLADLSNAERGAGSAEQKKASRSPSRAPSTADAPSRSGAAKAASRPNRPSSPGPVPGGSAVAGPSEVSIPVEGSPSGEQRRIAEGRFRHAQQSLAAGHHDYGLKVLLSCCAMDPGNVLYRQALREAQKASGTPPAGRVCPGFVITWLKFQAARLLHNHRKVLEHGERLLQFSPRDLGTQIEMAAAAEAIELVEVAVWLLERAREQEAGELRLNRALARLFERQRQIDKAATLWEQVSAADPTDIEASAKVRELAARKTLAQMKARR